MLCAIHYSTIIAQMHRRLLMIFILCVLNVVSTVPTKFNAPCTFPFAKDATCDFWAQRFLLLSSATLEGHLSEQMHPCCIHNMNTAHASLTLVCLLTMDNFNYPIYSRILVLDMRSS
ncbi:hypothetical protein BJV82DRAFT_588000 [Fennellomyces sp. T-0311]|nr:hypothetical protein BJV82DRAFT_588000 [Fennellomyces sp. T-0311]